MWNTRIITDYWYLENIIVCSWILLIKKKKQYFQILAKALKFKHLSFYFGCQKEMIYNIFTLALD